MLLGVVLLVAGGFVVFVAGGFVVPPVPQAIRSGIIHPSRPNRTNLRAIWEKMFMIILSFLCMRTENNPLDVAVSQAPLFEQGFLA